MPAFLAPMGKHGTRQPTLVDVLQISIGVDTVASHASMVKFGTQQLTNALALKEHTGQGALALVVQTVKLGIHK